MDAVLQGKFATIAYLPIESIIERISGRDTYNMEDLRKITEYRRYDSDAVEMMQSSWTSQERARMDQHKQWFWEILSEFDDEQKAQYLEFVWGRSRLPIKLSHEQHKFSLYDEGIDGRRGQRREIFKEDSIPQSHTCFFSFELPIYSSLAKFKEQLLRAMSGSKGVED